MTPSRTSAKGSFRFKRYFAGVGPIRRSAETRSKVTYRERDGVLTKLYKANRLDLLRDFQAKRLSIGELMELDRKGVLHSASAHDTIAHRNLWTVIEQTLPKMGKTEVTRHRYQASFDRCKVRGVLGASPTVAQLPTYHWTAIRKKWKTGPSDWNHLGRAFSRLLSLTVGAHHQMRLDFMNAFPFEKEPERMPDMTVETFERVVGKVPEWLRPVYFCLVATGMRIGEYLACERRHLYPETKQLHVPGTKTEGSDALLPIAETLWPWVHAAIPSPACYDTIRLHWQAAQKAAGITRRHTLHDIRHLTGQFLADAGLADAQIGRFLRHVAPQSVRRYSQRRLRAADAELLGNQFKGAYLRTNHVEGMRHGQGS